ncbi:DUF1249 domain-containing protein [Perlucidibaca piscinae]|uniref:DUF1249 domain-containing protein n=1 Tax=Perlucidibaca piscinae TaxID=392589 RepID=UPI0003B2FC9E|nr:DUF1249 domain-containing protein [Perlucidibaca piscinae]
MSVARTRYTVDLAGMHALYEFNYARLQKLLRGAGLGDRLGPVAPLEFAWGEPRVLALPGDALSDDDAILVQPVLQLQRVERTRYTETWRLAQMTPLLPWCPELDMEVRLFHDARMADVLRFQTARRIPAIVPVTHPAGWRVNEKQLVNHFLGDCLQLCLQQGLPRDPLLHPDYTDWDRRDAVTRDPAEDLETEGLE